MLERGNGPVHALLEKGVDPMLRTTRLQEIWLKMLTEAGLSLGTPSVANDDNMVGEEPMQIEVEQRGICLASGITVDGHERDATVKT
eukprot:53092-Eustigmatos_ZCMA.PRE.1